MRTQLRHLEFKGSSWMKTNKSPSTAHSLIKKNLWIILKGVPEHLPTSVKPKLSERNPTQHSSVFKKYFILCKGGIRSISAFYGLCTEFLLETKKKRNHRTSPWANCGPHPCLPRRNVWGSYSAAVTEHGLKQWAQCLSRTRARLEGNATVQYVA